MALPDSPSESTSALFSGLLFLITLSALQIWAPLFASTPQLTIAGGFVSSLLFFFGLICVGNLERETGWLEVVVCLGVALSVAATVHRVCVTTCLIFSITLLFYLNFMTRAFNNRKKKY